MTKIIRKKICLLGDFAVGKTSLARRYVYDIFDETYLTTIGVTLSQKSVLREEHELRLILWDLAGDEDFSRPETLYLRGTAGAMIVCDLTRMDSLKPVKTYATQLQEYSPGASMILIGNKADLPANRHSSQARDKLERLADDLNMRHLLTSAKTGTNVDEAFNLLADLIEAKYGEPV